MGKDKIAFTYAEVYQGKDITHPMPSTSSGHTVVDAEYDGSRWGQFLTKDRRHRPATARL